MESKVVTRFGQDVAEVKARRQYKAMTYNGEEFYTDDFLCVIDGRDEWISVSDLRGSVKSLYSQFPTPQSA